MHASLHGEIHPSSDPIRIAPVFSVRTELEVLHGLLPRVYVLPFAISGDPLFRTRSDVLGSFALPLLVHLYGYSELCALGSICRFLLKMTFLLSEHIHTQPRREDVRDDIHFSLLHKHELVLRFLHSFQS